jgi:hypothetical protein
MQASANSTDGDVPKLTYTESNKDIHLKSTFSKSLNVTEALIKHSSIFNNALDPEVEERFTESDPFLESPALEAVTLARTHHRYLDANCHATSQEDHLAKTTSRRGTYGAVLKLYLPFGRFERLW